jgi:hypothetical protein
MARSIRLRLGIGNRRRVQGQAEKSSEMLADFGAIALKKYGTTVAKNFQSPLDFSEHHDVGYVG